MPDIFNQSTGTFKPYIPDDTFVTLNAGDSDISSVGVLMSGITLQYTRNVNRILSLTNNNVYYVIGKAQGNGNINSVAGPEPLMQKFIEAYSGNNCKSGSMTFNAKVQCESESSAVNKGINISDIVLSGFNMQVSSADFMIQSGIGMLFGSMSFEK